MNGGVTMSSTQTRMQMPEFLPGDILLFAGKKGDRYTRLADWVMRTNGEGPTYAVHTAQFLDSRRVLEMDFVVRVKSIEDIINKRVDLNAWERRGFEVWRCHTLTDAQREALTDQALRYINIRFGYLKLIAHLLDGLLQKITHRDLYLFRQLDPDGSSPVCSGVTAFVFDRALHYRFGVAPEWADPDHIHDWLVGHPGEWKRVFALQDYATLSA
jgi:hypothetical protein